MLRRPAADRFALLTQLPALASLEQKLRALAEAAHATVTCSRVTVVFFAEDRCVQASVPQALRAFSLRDDSRALRRLFFPALRKFALDEVYYVPRAKQRSLAALTGYRCDADLLIVPLEAASVATGAMVFEIAAPPDEQERREIRVFADVAAWMLAREREFSAAEREARQSALLTTINERARRSLDRQSILETIVEDIRRSFDAMRCVIFARAANDAQAARIVAFAESAQAERPLPSQIEMSRTWLDRTFEGSVVSRESVEDDQPRDGFLRSVGAKSALTVPLAVEGHIEYAVSLQFAAPEAFGEIDMVMLRSIGSHVGLALANVQLYDLERLRRARAESLERVVRMLRDTQTIEEVLLVFAVTVSHEVKLTCAAYELEAGSAVRRALRTVDSARDGVPERVDLAAVAAQLDREDVLQSTALPAALQRAIFGGGEGVIASLRIDGNLWGMVVFCAAAREYDWNDAERRGYFHLLASHLELALSSALGFERIQQLARALAESNEFKDDLLAMLAHDFKGPLTVISGYCELLLENVPAVLRDELETIYAQTKRLVRLSEDAVALAQTQAGGFSLERAPVDLGRMLDESIKAHNRGHSRIRAVLPPQATILWLDPARFNHVLDNLLMNALKYSQDEIAVTLTRGAGNATITIADRGIGIPADELGAVFARFGRASNARRKGISGSGVGLYVSRKIVEVHGGSIAVQSKEGEGSTFTVTLPLPTGAGATERSQ